MLSVSCETTGQLPLLHLVDSDDYYLARRADVLWFEILVKLDWQPLVPVAAQYYEALYDFNVAQADAREKKERERPASNPETKGTATLRLLFARPTMDPDAPLLDEELPKERPLATVNPAALAPGRTPIRLSGRSPKCFFALFKAFAGLPLMGRPAEPEFVHQELVNNPSFARACGFTLPDPDCGYQPSDIPGLRKLEQFDQIMTENRLWQLAAVEQVTRNIESGKLEVDTTLVHDTTHYEAYSEMQVVEFPAKKEGAKPKRKSHPKTTKACRCAVWSDCPHDWISADAGAGTVVKARGKMVWGHKASTLSFAGQEILLDAVAMTDAASHDSRSLLAHLERVSRLYPEILEKVEILLDDSALDDQAISKQVKECYEIDLVVQPNPRGRKPIKEDLPRGIDHVTKAGTPVCRARFPFDFLGCRHEPGKFLFRAPDDAEGDPVCASCSEREGCLRRDGERRHLSIPFSRIPAINPEFSHLSRRFLKLMAMRTVIERIHKLMKFDYGNPRLTKRGTESFQATLDKTLLAMHLVVALN